MRTGFIGCCHCQEHVIVVRSTLFGTADFYDLRGLLSPVLPMAHERKAAEERRVRIASAFYLAEMAYRVARIGASGDRTAYIKGKWCVKSKSNPDWNGGCYDTKGEAKDRLKQVEAAKHAKGG